MTTSELAKIKATEDELYTLKVCVGGILGRELGLGNGQIKNDQIKVSDASSPVLQYPRYVCFRNSGRMLRLDRSKMKC